MDTANALHRGWNAEATGVINSDGPYPHISSSSSSSSSISGFTAINQPSTQFSTPRSSIAAPFQQNEARRRATVHRRRHNPTVAQYLGLGTASEPTRLDIYASSPATPPVPQSKSTQKRPKLAVHGNISDASHTNSERREIPDQRGVLESFRVVKPARKPAASTSKAPLHRATQSASIDHVRSQKSTVDGDWTTVSDYPLTTQICDVADHRFTSPETVRNVSQDSVATLPVQHAVDTNLSLLEHDDYDSNDAGHINFSLTPQQNETLIFSEDDFDFDINDDELLTLTSDIDGACSSIAKQTSSSSVQSSVDSDYRLHLDPGSSADTPIVLEEANARKSSQRLSKQFTSPVTLTTRLQVAYGGPGSAKARKPIVRPPFPGAVRDRSPIIGLSSSSLLRTCFRIGEAINQSGQALKSGKHIMIEMYARILDSERIGTEQQFTFCDLFHAKPPYITGAYSAAIWKSVQLFEYDSRRLLQQGRICRCIGTMKREEKMWTMTVLNIWEATWKDIECVEGIVNP